MTEIEMFGPQEDDNWDHDINIENGVADELVTELNGLEQRAQVTTYLSLFSIPGQEEAGIPWIDFFHKKITLTELDAKIREDLKKMTNVNNFVPTYSQHGTRLDIHLMQVQI